LGKTESNLPGKRSEKKRREVGLKSFRTALLTTGSLMAVCATAAPALAQQAEASPKLEEVVVTATRSASTVNKVAMAVSAVTQKSLEAQGIKDVNDLSRTVPGMTFRKTGGDGNPVITIRGIGGNGATVGSQTTGVYLDDSALQRRMINGLQTGNGAPFPQLFDLDRVEVLRGPQGTLYGGSSEGGTVRFITPTPSLTHYSGQVRSEVSTTENGSPNYEGAFALGGPIVEDKLGFRASVIARHNGGWVDAKSIYNGSTFAKDVNWGDSEAFRGTLRWEIDPTLQITPALYIGRDYSNAGDGVWGPSPQQDYAGGTVYNGSPSAQYANGACNKSGDPTGVPSITTGACTTSAIATYDPTTGKVSSKTYYFAFPNTTILPFTVNAMPWYSKFDSTGTGLYNDPTHPQYVASPRTTNLLLPSLTFDKDFHVVQVKSIFTYVHDVTDGVTFSGGGIGGRNLNRFMFGATECTPGMTTPRNIGGGQTACFVSPAYVPASAIVPNGAYPGPLPAYADWYNYHNDRTAKSEEMRFTGKFLNDRISYVSGGFYADSMIHMHGLEQNNENVYSQVIRGFNENWGNYTVLPVWGTSSAKPYTINTPYQDISDRNVHLHEREWAVFTEANFHATNKLTLTAGVRYNDYNQDFLQEYGGAPAGNPPPGTNPSNISPTNPLGGFSVTAAQVQAVSRNPALPNSAANPVTNPSAITALWATNLAGCPTAGDCPLQYTSLSDHEQTVSPKAGISYQLDPTTLFYFTYSKGYRPGGVNPPTSGVMCATDYARMGLPTDGSVSTPLTYQKDEVNSYELGSKVRLLDGRLQVNTSVFHIDWVGMQYNYSMTCGLAFVINAGNVVSNGAEIQANGRFGDWTLGANVGYDHAAFAQNLTPPNSTSVLVAKGDGIGTPDWTVSLNAQYDFHLFEMPGYVRADYNWTSAFQRSPGPGSVGYNPYTYMGPAYGTVNARLGLTMRGVDWNLFVQNASNAKPMIGWGGGTTGSATAPGTDSARYTGSTIRPRTIGLQGNYRF
jgi:outer membrane receptor protein involved in Fe transport